MKAALALAGAAMLAACSQSDEQADRLENAAAQSDPAAAEVLRNEAAAIREGDTNTNLSDPSSPAQGALANGGEAQLATPPSAQPTAPVGQATTSTEQAKPHSPGDPVPPPPTR